MTSMETIPKTAVTAEAQTTSTAPVLPATIRARASRRFRRIQGMSGKRPWRALPPDNRGSRNATAGALTLAVALVLGSCAPNGSTKVTSKPISEVLQAHTPELMAIPGVIGTGEGELRGEPTVLVLVARRTREIDSRVPKRLEGYPVDIRVVGEVRKLDGR